METKIYKEEGIEKSIRPALLSEFVGHNIIKDRLQILINSAKVRNQPLPHILFNGPPGLGKTTLALILAKEMGSSLTQSSGPAIEKPSDLAGILTNLSKGDVFFIDEIHRLAKNVEEYLYQAMEDFSLDIMIDSGPSARSVSISLQPFTLIGATTKTGLLSSPMRTRFGFCTRLDFYPNDDIEKILVRNASILRLSLKNCGCREIARRCRGTPRIANNLLRWVRDFTIKKTSPIKKEDATKALDMLYIDKEGLDEMDIRILSFIIDHHNGGPVGLKSIALAIGEDPQTIEEVQEPYLLMKGYLKRAKAGRQVTPLAYTHLKKNIRRVK